MEVLNITAESRETGKRETKAVRNRGFVPCNLYAKGIDPVSLSVDVRDLSKLIYAHELNKVALTDGKNTWECIVKNIDFHPVTDRPWHVDFLVLQSGHPVRLKIPVNYVGTPAGQLQGGLSQAVMGYMRVECLPKDIVGHIDVDVSELNIGDSIHVGDLEKGDVKFMHPDRQTMFAVVTTRVAVVEEEEEVEGEEGEEGAEGEGEETAEATEE